mmetsp:Transcript_5565/g.10056  ORF Transcript_5565/g.10056 Transcript_5565/m.10056 type:complete len:204 (-) Transcript_5565:187-798(-)
MGAVSNSSFGMANLLFRFGASFSMFFLFFFDPPLPLITKLGFLKVLKLLFGRPFSALFCAAGVFLGRLAIRAFSCASSMSLAKNDFELISTIGFSATNPDPSRLMPTLVSSFSFCCICLFWRRFSIAIFPLSFRLIITIMTISTGPIPCMHTSMVSKPGDFGISPLSPPVGFNSSNLIIMAARRTKKICHCMISWNTLWFFLW